MVEVDFHTVVIFDIDGVVRDVGGSYRRAIADTVEYFTDNSHRPTMAEIDKLKAEGVWNNDWEASQELIYRYWESIGRSRSQLALDYQSIVNFFQARYRGIDPHYWNGYIATEPLLLSVEYLKLLSQNQIGWGFFSGATRGSAEYVLKKRLGLRDIVLVAMEDAPGKPDPTGLLAAVSQLEKKPTTPVIYVGDTVADMYVIDRAQKAYPQRSWLAVGVLPPHISSSPNRDDYSAKLEAAGAVTVLDSVEQLTPELIATVISN